MATAQPPEQMTDQELRAFSGEHLYYEVEMAFAAGQLALRFANPASVEDWAIRNALIESFAAHVRVLKSFLYDQRGQPDDVIAADYVAVPLAWEQARGPVPAALTQAAQRTGKEVAHLTRRRHAGNVPEKQWAPYALLAALAVPLKQFVVMVPETRLAPRLRELVSAIQAGHA